MSLTERSERVLAEIDAGRMTHNVQIELIALVRDYHKLYQSESVPVGTQPIVVNVPDKDVPSLENA